MLFALLSACTPPPNWADELIDWPQAEGAYSDATLALNGARGGGERQGGRDVLSMNFNERATMQLSWSGRRVFDGPGVDLVVFENAFRFGEHEVFMDLLIVEVSANGRDWVAFDHRYSADDPLSYSARLDDWSGFAGKTPVLLNEDTHVVDPFNPALAGGDGFDLSQLSPDNPHSEVIWAEGASVLRLRSAATTVNPTTGQPYPHDPVANGPDIDAVYAKYFSPGDSL